MPVDQIAFQTQKDVLKEGSRLVANVNFRDRTTAAAVSPTNVRYRLDCLSSGAELLGWTAASPSSTVTLTITPALNAIQHESSKRETKQLTVAADYGLSTQYIETYEYEIINLRGTP